MIPSAILAATAGVSLGTALVHLRHRVLVNARIWVGGAALASAAAALYADGALTGWRPIDAVARAALGFGIVLFSARSRSRHMLVCAVVALAAATGAAVQPIAAAAAGLLVPAVISRRPQPLSRIIAGGMLVQVALRLSSAEITGVTAVLALAILAPIPLSAITRSDAEVRRYLRHACLFVGVFVVVGAGLGAAAALLAKPSLSRASEIIAQEVLQQGSDSARASDRLLSARRDFRTSRRILGNWLVRPAAAVPIVAQHWRALHAAAISGEQLADLGLRTARSIDATGLYVTEGQVPLNALSDLEPVLARASGELGAARRRLAAADSAWLVPPLRGRFDDVRARVSSAEAGTRTALRVLPHLPALLGSEGTRRYFLAVQTPAELRGSGGFMGNYGEITADNGKLTLTRFGSIVELMGGDLSSRRLLAPPDYTRRYSRFVPEQEWGNVNLSPDFPTNAKVIAGLYPQSGGQPIHGVVAVDPKGLAALFRVVGPVTVRRWPTPLTADNIQHVLLREQYAVFDQQERERQQFVADVTQGVWGRLTSGSLRLSKFLGAVGPAIDGKHLQFSGTAEREQRLFEDLGAAGVMKPVDGDFLGVVSQNAGASKLDVFLRRKVDYRVQLDPSNGDLRARVRLTLYNDAPRNGLPAYVVGQTTPPVAPGDNKLYLSIYTPWRLAGAHIDGKTAVVEREQELGRQVYSTFLVVPARGRTVVELDLTGRLSTSRSYRLTLHRQPAAAPDHVETTLEVPFGWRVGGAIGTEASDHHRLDADRTLDVTVRRQW